MDKIISKDGTAIAFDRMGTGPALILVDGALCSRTFGPMPKLAPLLSKHFTVYLYDRRGRGDSGDKAPYEVNRELEDLDSIIKLAGGEAYVFGISSGAALALIAATSDLNIKMLALYEPPYWIGEVVTRPLADYRMKVTQLIREGKRGKALQLFMSIVGVPSFFIFMMQLMPVWSKLKAVAHTLPYDAAVMGDFSFPFERAKSLKVQSVVIGGGKSPPNLRQAVENLASTIPFANKIMLPEQTHNVNVNVLAPALINFFKRNGN